MPKNLKIQEDSETPIIPNENKSKETFDVQSASRDQVLSACITTTAGIVLAAFVLREVQFS